MWGSRGPGCGERSLQNCQPMRPIQSGRTRGGSLVNTPSTQDDNGSSAPQPISVEADLPSERADRFTKPLGRFLKIEAAAGAALPVATCAALILSNSAWSAAFSSIWEIPVGLKFDWRIRLPCWTLRRLVSLAGRSFRLQPACPGLDG